MVHFYFGALHAEAAIGVSRDVFLGDQSPEAWPTGAGFELRIRVKQRGRAADAAVNPRVVIFCVLAGERRFGTLAPGDVELLGVELFLPFGVRLDEFIDRLELPSSCQRYRTLRFARLIRLAVWESASARLTNQAPKTVAVAIKAYLESPATIFGDIPKKSYGDSE